MSWEKIKVKRSFLGKILFNLFANPAESAKIFLDNPGLHFSREGLIANLEYLGFTHKKAVHAVDRCGADWNERAIAMARDYLNSPNYYPLYPEDYPSREGLIAQLKIKGECTHEKAVYGADNCGADWNEQAKLAAKRYLSDSMFSRNGLISKLKQAKFTHNEAVQAVDRCGADWNEQAIAMAKECLNTSNDYLNYFKNYLSREGLIAKLEKRGECTHEKAVYGADNCGADWNEQAKLAAKKYLSFSAFSRNELIDELKRAGFTHNEAVYGVKAIGY